MIDVISLHSNAFDRNDLRPQTMSNKGLFVLQYLVLLLFKCTRKQCTFVSGFRTFKSTPVQAKKAQKVNNIFNVS